MNIIMLGAPGAGKGTMSSKLKEKLNIPHISTGDIFRENIKNNTDLGKLAKSYIEKGALVPDTVTINMMIDRLSKSDAKEGFILDGFPRNIAQADGLKIELEKLNKKIDLVLLIDAEDNKIMERLSGRRVCEKCGESFHIVNMKPKVDGICDKCGSKLIIRKDDTKEVIEERLKTYHEQTAPLINYYENEGVLKTIDGFNNLDENLKLVIEMLK